MSCERSEPLREQVVEHWSNARHGFQGRSRGSTPNNREIHGQLLGAFTGYPRQRWLAVQDKTGLKAIHGQLSGGEIWIKFDVFFIGLAVNLLGFGTGESAHCRKATDNYCDVSLQCCVSPTLTFAFFLIIIQYTHVLLQIIRNEVLLLAGSLDTLSDERWSTKTGTYENTWITQTN